MTRSARVERNRLFAATVITAIVVLFAWPAGAHLLGLSRGEYTPDGAMLRAIVVLRADDAALVVSGLDSEGDGSLVRKIARAGPALKAAFVDELAITADGAPCSSKLFAASFDPPDSVRLEATYACPAPPGHLHIHFGFLDHLPAGHRHFATLHLAGGDATTLVALARPDFDVDVGAPPKRGFASFLRAGIEHILHGPDHLAFLLALVLGGAFADREVPPSAGTRRGARALVAMLTAFTVGHSASLALATLGGLAPGPRFVEPAVALSVAYVGAENLWSRSPSHRWRLTLPFGFVHGFAFAGGLLPLGLHRGDLPAALFGFNLGVEIGQLVVIAMLLPLVAWAPARATLARCARRASAAILVAGLVWFVVRVAAVLTA